MCCCKTIGINLSLPALPCDCSKPLWCLSVWGTSLGEGDPGIFWFAVGCRLSEGWREAPEWLVRLSERAEMSKRMAYQPLHAFSRIALNSTTRLIQDDGRPAVMNFMAEDTHIRVYEGTPVTQCSFKTKFNVWIIHLFSLMELFFFKFFSWFWTT